MIINLAIKTILKTNVSLSFACTDIGSIEDFFLNTQFKKNTSTSSVRQYSLNWQCKKIMNLAIKTILYTNVSLSFACTDKGSIEDFFLNTQFKQNTSMLLSLIIKLKLKPTILPSHQVSFPTLPEILP